MTPRAKSLALCGLSALFLVSIVIPLGAAEPGQRPAKTPAKAPAKAKTPARQPVTGTKVLSDTLRAWADVIEPVEGKAAKTYVTKIKLTRAEGLPDEVAGVVADLAYQAPDRLRLSAEFGGAQYAIGRDGRQAWVHQPAKKFGLIGSPDVPRFKATPDEKDGTVLPPFKLPVSRTQLMLMALTLQAELKEPQELDGVPCHVLKVSVGPATAKLLGVKDLGPVELWVRESDHLPARLAYTDGKKLDVQVDFVSTELAKPWAAEKWKLTPQTGDKIETVALSHLVRFMQAAPRALNPQIATLGPATGEKRLIAAEGKGRLEEHDGTLVLFLKGSPEEMGHQHGTLLKTQIRDLTERVIYAVGVGSSFEKGEWFLGDIEDAQLRFQPFVDKRHLAEMDAIAQAAGMHYQEARLSNFFPELFHCSGFSVFGKATKDGRMYHGRILDYMKGIGLEQNAVVIVHQPDYGHAWVNLSYAGFVGSISAMNEKGISIGEMGGGGYGNWDGKPMAHLMREVMEEADTLEEAVAIMRKGPRTCEYYYVISDGKSKDAVGIAATHDTFEVIRPGEAHPKLPHSIGDAVLMSAGDRYEELARRVKDGYGKFDADSARELMTRPVCMTSNIQSVLFAPDTLDLWVANADGKNVASHTRYTHYNLKALLESEAPKVDAAAAAAAAAGQ